MNDYELTILYRARMIELERERDQAVLVRAARMAAHNLNVNGEYKRLRPRLLGWLAVIRRPMPAPSAENWTEASCAGCP